MPNNKSSLLNISKIDINLKSGVTMRIIKFIKDRCAVSLPIYMVVMVIVGMAGLAATLSFIKNSEEAIPKPVHANIKSNSLIILSAYNDLDIIEVKVDVINSYDGTPINKATVTLYGLGAGNSSLTNNKGEAVLVFHKKDFNFDASEGYLDLRVKATGFKEYLNENVVKIVK